MLGCQQVLTLWARNFCVMFTGSIHFAVAWLLKRCRKYFTLSDLLPLYTTYIRSRMEYNYYVWADASMSIFILLFRLQKRTRVFVYRDKVSNSSIQLRASLQWDLCIAITTDFGQTKYVELFSRIMFPN